MKYNQKHDRKREKGSVGISQRKEKEHCSCKMPNHVVMSCSCVIVNKDDKVSVNTQEDKTMR